jgi:hypothetical protein
MEAWPARPWPEGRLFLQTGAVPATGSASCRTQQTSKYEPAPINFWEQAGKPEGREDKFWHQAEQELQETEELRDIRQGTSADYSSAPHQGTLANNTFNTFAPSI